MNQKQELINQIGTFFFGDEGVSASGDYSLYTVVVLREDGTEIDIEDVMEFLIQYSAQHGMSPYRGLDPDRAGRTGKGGAEKQKRVSRR